MQRIWMTITALVTLAATSVNADMLPRKPQGRQIQMRIVESQVAAGGIVLQIPAELLHVRADVAPPFPFSGGQSSWRDVIAGAFLSLGLIISGKRWFHRSGKKGNKLYTAPAVLLLAASAAMLAPSRSEAQNAENLGLAHAQGDLSGTVTAQVVDNIHEVILHLTPPRRPVRPRPTPGAPNSK